MRPSPIAPALVALALAACGAPGAGTTGGGSADIRAEAVAEALRGTDGVSGVTTDGSAVTATIDAPLPAAGLDEGARARIGEATRTTFTASLCEQAGLDAFFAAGGTLILAVRGSDGGSLAEVPVGACV